MPRRRISRGPLLLSPVGGRDSTNLRVSRSRRVFALALGTALAGLALVGCGQTTTDSSTAISSRPAPPTTGSTARPTARARKRAPVKHHKPPTHGQAGLPYSTAPADTVQRQPAAGSCHSIGSGLYSRPDPLCTPGALNPAVTQATIGQTICQSGWTSTVRPPESVTETEKAASMAAYGDSAPLSAYEYDHFIPLELGGAVNDARNLWPEPGASPNPKDAVEDELRQKVCDGQMTLARAQRAIAANWIALAGSTSGNTPSGAQCSLSASYSDRYHDYDVYVHSNVPAQTVTVTDTAGRSATWHTDASGYADVFFRAPSDAAGETITARVGGASCHGAL